MHRHLARLSLLLGTVCLLSACGFQLRGSGGGTSLPDEWRLLYLVTPNPNNEISREITTNFAANGVTWVPREEANYLVILGMERASRRNLSLNADARAAEIELGLRIQFSVQDAQGNEILEPSDASVFKQMENDPANVVGKAEEVRILQGEMRNELALQIMRRIGFFAASTN